MSFEAEAMDAPPVQPSRGFPWGCLLGGCASMLVLCLVGVGLTGYGFYRFYQGQVAKYTSEAPTELPAVEFDPVAIEALEQRVEQFQKQVEKEQAVEELVLTETEINALIARKADWKNRVYVTIKDGEVSAELSLPMDQFPGGKGRYFNGSVTLEASLEDGVLVVAVKDASVNGASVPEQFMTEIRKQNLAEELSKDPDAAKWIARFKGLRIEDNAIILTPRSVVDEEQVSSPESDAQDSGTDADVEGRP